MRAASEARAARGGVGDAPAACAPMVSIVLTVYNVASCLEQTLNSLSAQTFEDFEVLCVDDGSTDASPEILRAHAADDERFTVITQQNAGPGPARNAGLAAAQGEFVMLLDGDDVFDPTFVERMVQRARETNADVVVCASDELDAQSGRRTANPWALRVKHLPDTEPFAPEDTKGCLFHVFKGWPWDKLYRRQLIDRNRLRFPALPNSEDAPFVFGTLVHAQRIATVRTPLIAHRMSRQGSVSNSRLAHPECFYQAIEMVQADVRQNPARCHSLEWGFLNWATDYAVWNIATLPKGSPERAELVRKFATGGFPALELDTHVPEFYALNPETPDGIRAIYAEYAGKPLSKRSARDTLRAVYRAIKPAHPLDDR